MNPRVSVIIPTYNRKEWLAEAIDSVERQTFTDFEILVVDHGSTDGTAAMLKARAPDRVRVLQIPNCPLPACPRNEGIRAAGGEFIAFLDSDDLWLPTKLDRQIKFLEQAPEAGWCYANARRFGEGLRTQDVEAGPWQLREGRVFSALLNGNFIPACTVMVRRSCLVTVGVFSLDPEVRGSEDYELWLRLAARYPIAVVRETLALYRVSPHQMSSDLSRAHVSEIRALESAFQGLRVAEPARRRALAAVHLRHFRSALLAGGGNGDPFLRESLRLDPWRPRAWLYWIFFRWMGRSLTTSWFQREKSAKRFLWGLTERLRRTSARDQRKEKGPASALDPE
ncbi:MAG: glycosyltransferase [Elusimicrobia bacterium]|nr:glycosyltransferase [Elusimicrobiota bacterium]